MILRPKDAKPKEIALMEQKAKQRVDEWTQYDKRAAISDIFDGRIKQNNITYNCGEYVHDILSTIYPEIMMEDVSIPITYKHHPNLQRWYITKLP